MPNSYKNFYEKYVRFYRKTTETLGCFVVISFFFLLVYLIGLLGDSIFGVSEMSSVEKRVYGLYGGLIIIGYFIVGLWNKTFEEEERAKKYQEILWNKIDKLEKKIDRIKNDRY